ncbi:transcription factor Opi1-domain-containing protein [Mycena rebaudengoi]|nr:transcription factor Opi1-domain-containing protein [Mycena rebaudengoi]
MNLELEDEDVRIAVRALGDMRSGAQQKPEGNSNNNSGFAFPTATPTPNSHSRNSPRSSTSHTPALSLSLASTHPSESPPRTPPPDGEEQSDRDRDATQQPYSSLARMSSLPLVSGALRVYEAGKANSRVVQYTSTLVSTSLRHASSRLPAGSGERMDEFAGGVLDRLDKYRGSPAPAPAPPVRRGKTLDGSPAPSFDAPPSGSGSASTSSSTSTPAYRGAERDDDNAYMNSRDGDGYMNNADGDERSTSTSISGAPGKGKRKRGADKGAVPGWLEEGDGAACLWRLLRPAVGWDEPSRAHGKRCVSAYAYSGWMRFLILDAPSFVVLGVTGSRLRDDTSERLGVGGAAFGERRARGYRARATFFAGVCVVVEHATLLYLTSETTARMRGRLARHETDTRAPGPAPHVARFASALFVPAAQSVPLRAARERWAGHARLPWLFQRRLHSFFLTSILFCLLGTRIAFFDLSVLIVLLLPSLLPTSPFVAAPPPPPPFEASGSGSGHFDSSGAGAHLHHRILPPLQLEHHHPDDQHHHANNNHHQQQQHNNNSQQQQHQVAQRSRWHAMLLEAGGLSAALSDESMRRLRYVLGWLQYATQHIDAQILILRDFIASLGDPSSGDAQYPPDHPDYQPQHITPDHLRTLAHLRSDIVHTIRQVVGVISKYAGGALPEPARGRVRGFILELPRRFGEGGAAAGAAGGGAGGGSAGASGSSATGTGTAARREMRRERGTGVSSPGSPVGSRPGSPQALRNRHGGSAGHSQHGWVDRLRTVGIQRGMDGLALPEGGMPLSPQTWGGEESGARSAGSLGGTSGMGTPGSMGLRVGSSSMPPTPGGDAPSPGFGLGGMSLESGPGSPAPLEEEERREQQHREQREWERERAQMESRPRPESRMDVDG